MTDLEKEAREAAERYAPTTVSEKLHEHGRSEEIENAVADFVAGYLAATEPREKRIAELEATGDALRLAINSYEAKVAELEEDIAASNKVVVHFTRVSNGVIYDRDCHSLLLDTSLKDAIINAHTKGD